MGGLKQYADLLIVAGIIAALWIYTVVQRHDAVRNDRASAAAATTKKVYQVQRKKNEIRNRPVADPVTIKRLRKLSW